MTENKITTIKTERIDDIPLLLHLQSKMGIGVEVSQVINVHGNREGMSIGALIMVWLSYILSQCDHRMSEVEEWAKGQMTMLRTLISNDIEIKDFSDDRLADILRLLSNDADWEQIEINLGQRLVRVYQLGNGLVRLDSTAVAVYHNQENSELFKQGYSKDHRPDLAQFKVMLATLDPLGMPLATLVIDGKQADDGLYSPAIDRAQAVLGKGSRLYVGDSKMAALDIRGKIAKALDYYLMPLPQTGNNPKLLKEMVLAVGQNKQSLQIVHMPSTVRSESESESESESKSKSKSSVMALGYEVLRSQQTMVDGKMLQWEERILAVFSPSLARQQRQGLQKRLATSQERLLALTEGKTQKQWQEQCLLQAAVEAIIKQYKIEGLVEVEYENIVQTVNKRKYGQRAANSEVSIIYKLKVKRNLPAISLAHRLMGWRLYASNCPTQQLSFLQAVESYRASPRIEHNFSRLKGKPLGIRPLYVHREDHTKGMVRLLSLALRILTLTEFVVRQALSISNTSLSGLYSGNPKRQTSHPSSERLFKAFQGITLTLVCLPEQVISHITSLSLLQSQLLHLLGFSTDIYQDIATTLSSFSLNSIHRTIRDT
jgi:transposase